MAETSIEWADDTLNLIYGCERVSEGCRHCYAEPMAARLALMGQALYDGLTTGTGRKARWTGDVRVPPVEEAVAKIRAYKRGSKGRRIFVQSMADLFHKDVPIPWLVAVIEAMGERTEHVWMLLTKRADRLPEVARAVVAMLGAWPSNVWMGVSVENQDAANKRIPDLLQVPAAVRWLSMEPLLGPVDVRPWLDPDAFCQRCDSACDDCPWGRAVMCDEDFDPDSGAHPPRLLHWVIVGGESGPDARPMHPEWARSLRDQCVAAGVPFFFKQWGRWAPERPADWAGSAGYVKRDGSGWGAFTIDGHPDAPALMCNVGKHAAGRLLDGRTWDQVPHVGA